MVKQLFIIGLGCTFRRLVIHTLNNINSCNSYHIISMKNVFMKIKMNVKIQERLIFFNRFNHHVFSGHFGRDFHFLNITCFVLPRPLKWGIRWLYILFKSFESPPSPRGQKLKVWTYLGNSFNSQITIKLTAVVLVRPKSPYVIFLIATSLLKWTPNHMFYLKILTYPKK